MIISRFCHCIALVCGLITLASGAEYEIFDGKTLDGWTTQKGEPITRGWRVEDGAIHLVPTKPRAGNIITRCEFANFRLYFEWKIAAGGNSGVKYKVRRYDGNLRGCEYQIIDDANYRHPLQPRHRTGAIYDLFAPVGEPLMRPPGEFNSSQIVVRGRQIEHWLNGQLVSWACIGDPVWRSRVAESKFNELPDFSEQRCGKIMLTDHSEEVWYRNLRLEVFP